MSAVVVYIRNDYISTAHIDLVKMSLETGAQDLSGYKRHTNDTWARSNLHSIISVRTIEFRKFLSNSESLAAIRRKSEVEFYFAYVKCLKVLSHRVANAPNIPVSVGVFPQQGAMS